MAMAEPSATIKHERILIIVDCKFFHIKQTHVVFSAQEHHGRPCSNKWNWDVNNEKS